MATRLIVAYLLIALSLLVGGALIYRWRLSIRRERDVRRGVRPRRQR